MTEFIYKGYTFFKGTKYKGVTSTGYRYTENHCGVRLACGFELCSIGSWKGNLYSWKQAQKFPHQIRFWDDKVNFLNEEYTPERIARLKVLFNENKITKK